MIVPIGERSFDETRALNKRISNLTVDLEETNSQHSVLLNQLKVIEENLNKAKRYHKNMNDEKGDLLLLLMIVQFLLFLL